MSIFATEIEVKNGISKSTFVAAIVAWLRGINRSTILDGAEASENYDDEVWRENALGETFSLKSFEDRDNVVFGARLEIPDERGLKWRTECVLTSSAGRSYLRVRGQCVAVSHSAEVSRPKKPHLIRQAIEDGWCVPDGSFEPSLDAFDLNASQLEIATAAIDGQATTFLPILYVSRGNQDSLPFNVKAVAKTLAGICYVLVEPSRSFSFELMETTKRRNPYGGAVALFTAEGKEKFRIFRKPQDAKGRNLEAVCIEQVNAYVSSLAPKHAWEWQDLQEAQSRKLREAVLDVKSGELDEFVAAFDSEVDAYKERIEDLERRLEIETIRADGEALVTEDLIPMELKQRIGPELYEGEFTDRLRSFLEMALCESNAARNSRTDEFVRRLLKQISFSGRSYSLISQIKSASKDGNQMPKQLGAVLSVFGFTKSQDSGHIKFSPPEELFGLQLEVLPSTPSDSQRGGKNRGSEVIRNFGLNELK